MNQRSFTCTMVFASEANQRIWLQMDFFAGREERYKQVVSYCVIIGIENV